MTTAILAASLSFSILLVGITSSASYDPWCDLDDDGDIDIFDIVKLASAYGTSGTPINKTALLLEMQARIDALNATITSLKECIVVTGSSPYDGNGAYDPIIGRSTNVSSVAPAEFTLVAAAATGYKAHQMTGARQDEPRLILEPKVSGTVFQTRGWDASGDEYGGANWASMRAHIDYTLFFTK